jgi:hypothetical protein
MTRQLSSRFWSLACALPLLAPAAVAAQEGSPGTDAFTKAIKEQKEADSKLKSSYQDLVLEHKQTTQLATGLATSKAQLASLPYNYTTTNTRNVLRNQITTMESEQEKKKVTWARKEAEFKADEKRILESLNQSLPPLLKEISLGDDKKATDAVLSVFDMFVFSDYKEIPALRIGSAFQDQEAWQAVSHTLTTSGTKQLGEFKKILNSSRNAATRYAVVAALGEIGAEADKADKTLYDTLYKQVSLLKASKLERNEKDAREKIYTRAMEALRPDKK